MTWFHLQSHKDGLGLMWLAVPYIRSLTEHLYLFPRCLFSNIILLPLYRSLPYRSIRSCCIAGAVLNLDGSNGAAIGCCLNKE